MRDADRDEESSESDPENPADFGQIEGGVQGEPTSSEDPDDQSENPATQFESLSDRFILTPEGVAFSTATRPVDASVRPESLSSRQRRVATIESTVVEVLDQPVSPVRPAGMEDRSDSDSTSTESDSNRDSSTTLPSVSDTVGVGTYRTRPSETVIDPIQLHERETNQTESVGTLRQTVLSVDTRDVTHTMQPESATAGEQPRLEEEIEDPGYEWRGGTPYSVTKPQCIVHVDPSEFDSLPFLQRVLRDTYTELEGGRPRTKTLTTRAGTFKSVTVHGSVVTLDLTGDAWSVDATPNGIDISHENGEPLSDLRNLVDSLYGGKLGYLLLNVSQSDLESRFRSDLEAALVRTLVGLPDRDVARTDDHDPEEDSGHLSQSQPPIRVAKPRPDDEAAFRKIVSQYFGFESARDERVAEIEAAQEARLRRNDWARIALTERQQEEDRESDEHYLWKATLAGGLAWQMKEQYAQRNEEISFDTFVSEHLLRSGLIDSEADGPFDEAVPDLLVSASASTPMWSWLGTQDFLAATSLDLDEGTDLVIEFETGRGEGAFNLRKLRETVEKYGDEEGYKLCVVVPPRILFRSESRARMIERLVEGSGEPEYPVLCLPELGRSGCDQLVAAPTRLDQWFGDDQ